MFHGIPELVLAAIGCWAAGLLLLAVFAAVAAEVYRRRHPNLPPYPTPQSDQAAPLRSGRLIQTRGEISDVDEYL